MRTRSKITITRIRMTTSHHNTTDQNHYENIVELSLGHRSNGKNKDDNKKNNNDKKNVDDYSSNNNITNDSNNEKHQQ